MSGLLRRVQREELGCSGRGLNHPNTHHPQRAAVGTNERADDAILVAVFRAFLELRFQRQQLAPDICGELIRIFARISGLCKEPRLVILWPPLQKVVGDLGFRNRSVSLGGFASWREVYLLGGLRDVPRLLDC